MRNLIFALIIISTHANAATPFTVSGAKIDAIFQSSKIWSKLTGEVQSIAFRGLKDGITTYEIKTLEHSKKNGHGDFKALKKPKLCLSIVKVKNSGDPLAPKWILDSADFSQCQ